MSWSSPLAELLMLIFSITGKHFPELTRFDTKMTSSALLCASHTPRFPRFSIWFECRNLQLLHLTTRQASLEDVFVHLTGRHLREE